MGDHQLWLACLGDGLRGDATGPEYRDFSRQQSWALDPLPFGHVCNADIRRVANVNRRSMVGGKPGSHLYGAWHLGAGNGAH